ncbi:tryptophan dimethylallyltransferase family protein [Allokutzneria oryzae]|uniref:Tryptophan dimethylallyltransferase family protein n=1 Tax=Allokutzneria oryzae TaxID=1378989 RepID=A0ABV6A888_9PSEU
MDLSAISLREYASEQLQGLHRAVGFMDAPRDTMDLLSNLLGPGGVHLLSEPPLWSSDLSDDKTPIEFSVAFEGDGTPTVRLCVEPTAERPSHAANVQVSKEILQFYSERFNFSLEQFHRVSELFLSPGLRGRFAIWVAVVLKRNDRPSFKVYFTPDERALAEAPALIEEALHRLGFRDAFGPLCRHALRPGLGLDHFTFFSLDLGERSRSRVKVYASHFSADVTDIERAARLARGVEPGRLRDFCYLVGGGPGPFAARPLISSYAFVEGDTDRPSGYTLHLPIRDYVTDDALSRARVNALLSQQGFDSAPFEDALGVVARRPLDQGVGMIPYASLRLGLVRPGVTVYLSSELYQVVPPRSWHSLAENFSVPAVPASRAGDLSLNSAQ